MESLTHEITTKSVRGIEMRATKATGAIAYVEPGGNGRQFLCVGQYHAGQGMHTRDVAAALAVIARGGTIAEARESAQEVYSRVGQPSEDQTARGSR